MENKIRIDEFLTEINDNNAAPKTTVTYNWWPDNKLKLEINGNEFLRIDEDDPNTAYKEAYENLKRILLIGLHRYAR
jgi:hypothetical protein